MKPMRRHAFTLIELLVVVAIIGILASLLLPVLNKAREAARVAGAKSVIKQIDTACLTYLDQNGEYPADECVGYTSDVAFATETYLYQLMRRGTSSPYLGANLNDLRNSAGNNTVDATINLLDPWRRPYSYCLAPQRRSYAGVGTADGFKTFPGNTGGVNIFSRGRDGLCESCDANDDMTIGDLPTGAVAATHDTTYPTSGVLVHRHCGGQKKGRNLDPCNWK